MARFSFNAFGNARKSAAASAKLIVKLADFRGLCGVWGAGLGVLMAGILVSCVSIGAGISRVSDLVTDSGAEGSINDEGSAGVAFKADGDVIEDPHLWLEGIEDAAALDWVTAQNDRSLARIEGVAGHAGRLAAAKSILVSEDKLPVVGLRDGYAYNFWQDTNNPRGVWRRMRLADYAKATEEASGDAGKVDAGAVGGTGWEVLLDIDKLAESEDTNWVFKGTSCLPPAGERCMITLSDGGTDAAVEREFDIETKSFVLDGFFLPEAKSETAWLSKDALLVGTEIGEGSVTTSGYPREVRLWRRGQDVAEAPVVFSVDTDDVAAWPYVFTSGEMKIAGALRAKTFYKSEVFMFDNSIIEETGVAPALRQLPVPEMADVRGLSNGALIVVPREPWQFGDRVFEIGSVVAFDLESETAQLVFEVGTGQAIDNVRVTDQLVYIGLLDAVKGAIIAARPVKDGWQKTRLDLPRDGVLSIASTDQSSGALLALYEDPTTPEQLYLYTVTDDVVSDTPPQLIDQSPSFYKSEGVTTLHLEAVSKDGTKIPYAVTAQKSVLDGPPAPTIQYGYGGFQISILPAYNALKGKLWVEQGGVWVTTSIRGGGEFGPEWHQSALFGNRQLAYDDFFAISEDLIARGITTAEQLGISGRSNGGLLMGVAFTQRPDLYAAIACGVPLLDMLRYHKLLAGASWMGEYGNPDKAEDREWLTKISPYHNVREGTAYPEMFIYTSTLDDRVHPGHARKMVALLNDLNIPVLYYENTEGGHAAANNPDQYARREALQISYFADKLGLAGE